MTQKAAIRFGLYAELKIGRLLSISRHIHANAWYVERDLAEDGTRHCSLSLVIVVIIIYAMDTASRLRCRPWAECALHHHGVEPAAELVADALEDANHTKAGGAMQFDRRGLRRVADHGDHLAQAPAA